MKKLITILILIISFDSIGQQFADTTALKTYINDSIPQNFFTHDRTRQLKNAIFSVINFTGGGGGGGGSVTSVSAGFGTSFTTITGTGSVIVDTTSGGVLSWRRGAKLMDSLNTVNLTGNGTATYVPYYSTARVLTSNVRFSYAASTGTLILRGLTSTDNALLINTFNDVANAHIFKTSGIASLALPAGTDVGIGVSASGTSGAKLIVKGDATNTAGAFFRGNADANIAFGINTANDASNRHLFYSNGDAKMSMGSGTVQIGTAGTNTGVLKLTGSTSGTVSIQPANTAGTWTMTLPTDGGTTGYVLTTDGSGTTSWAAGGAGTYVDGGSFSTSTNYLTLTQTGASPDVGIRIPPSYLLNPINVDSLVFRRNDSTAIIKSVTVSSANSKISVSTTRTDSTINHQLTVNEGNFTTLAPLASPTFTGTPAAPTAAANTNTTQLATTAFVIAERTNTATLTNKRWTARVGSTTSSATPTINTDNFDIYKITAQTVDITSFTTNLTGTPVDGDVLEIQITGTATRNITWGSSFVSSTVTLPTATVSTATLTVVFQYYTTSSYGNNKWVCASFY